MADNKLEGIDVKNPLVLDNEWLATVREETIDPDRPMIDTQHHLLLEHERVADVVLIFSGVAYVDTSGVEMLENMEEALSASNVTLHLAEVKGPVMDRLYDTELYRRLGPGRVHLSTDIAVRKLAARLPSGKPGSA